MTYASADQGAGRTIAIGSKGGNDLVNFESSIQLTLRPHYGGTDGDLAGRVGPGAGAGANGISVQARDMRTRC